MADIVLAQGIVAVRYTTEEVINLVEPSITFEVCINPGGKFTQLNRTATLQAMCDGKVIHGLHRKIFQGTITYIWEFKVPIDNLKRVEWSLRRKHISYRKITKETINGNA